MGIIFSLIQGGKAKKSNAYSCTSREWFFTTGTLSSRPGRRLYLADLDEIWERFGRTSERRRMLFSRLRTFVELARHVGTLRMFVDGSYVTAKTEPEDVDVVIWVGEKFLELLEQGDENALNLELMFLTREPKEAFAVFDEDGWNAWLDFFSSIRNREEEKKGLVEVCL